MVYFPAARCCQHTWCSEFSAAEADCCMKMSSPVVELRSKLSPGLLCWWMQQHLIAFVVSLSLSLSLSRWSVMDVYMGVEIVCSDQPRCCQQEIGGGRNKCQLWQAEAPCRGKWPTLTGSRWDRKRTAIVESVRREEKQRRKLHM